MANNFRSADAERLDEYGRLMGRPYKTLRSDLAASAGRKKKDNRRLGW